jgi:hypothetical protein
MKLIRKSTWTVMILGAAAGCAGEEATPPAAETGAAPAVAKPAPADIPPPPPLPKAGETKKTDEAPAVEGPKAENSKADSGAGQLTADEITAIKELPEPEQALATKQLNCPVSAHHLGSMGKPMKVTAEGRTFYICCDGCEEKVKTDPKAVIAKLDKK